MSKKSKQTKSYVLKVPVSIWRKIRKEGDDREKTYEEMLLIGAELSAHLERLIALSGVATLDELLTRLREEPE